MSRIRLAVTVVFFVSGALFASWASRIPALADRIGASTGALGLALLAPAVGAVILMPPIGRALQGRSSQKFCTVALIALMVAVALPALAPSVAGLALVLVSVGAANATLDVAMNVQGQLVGLPLAAALLSAAALLVALLAPATATPSGAGRARRIGRGHAPARS